MKGDWLEIERELALQIQSGRYLPALRASRHAGDPLLARAVPDARACALLARRAVDDAQRGIELVGSVHDLELSDLDAGKTLYRGAELLHPGSGTGRWWFDEKLLRGALREAHTHGTDETSRMAIFSYSLRRKLAVQFDWSKLNDWVRMVLPAGMTVPCISGEGQPKHMYAKESWESERLHQMSIANSLPGKALQYFLPIVPGAYAHGFRLDIQSLH